MWALTQEARQLKQVHRQRLAVDMYVMDLRGNMGGLLTAGIKLAEGLLPYGQTITTLEAADGAPVTHLVYINTVSSVHDWSRVQTLCGANHVLYRAITCRS